MEFHALSCEFVSSDNYIDFSVGKFFQHFLGLFCRSCPRKIIHLYGKIFQSLAKSFVMLKSKHRSRHKHCHLFIIARRLKGSTYRNFCFAKTNIATNKPIHGTRFFHILFYSLTCLRLIGSILVNKRSFKFVLHKVVATKSESLFRPSLCV